MQQQSGHGCNHLCHQVVVDVMGEGIFKSYNMAVHVPLKATVLVVVR